MSKDLQQPQQSEEVDLGQLFKLIGKGFDKFFNFIGNIFKRIYDLFLFFLIHIFKRLKWYALAVITGVVIGYIIDKNLPYLYGANMQVETKYDSARQVYENISFLNQLAAIDRDSVELAKILKITPREASSIKGITIEPNIDENNKIKLFSDFRAQLDSLTRSTYTYNNYIEGLTSYSFKKHQIEVSTTDKFIYPKINASLANQLANNLYLNERKDTKLKNLSLKQLALEEQKKSLDSLKIMYLSIRKSESEKQIMESGSGTNLYLGENQQQSLIVDETKLLERILDLNNEKLQINADLIDNKYVVNIISEFPAIGYNTGKLLEKSKVRLPLLFVFITWIVFVFIGLNRYLKKEETRLLS